ncbi:hypothetical protein WCE39_13990 [Luteimonas sp. MJ174]|uniref:hypothetical protein n=1 Tax=Luteimonas sp. MJ174 TaxID=3129237 RepID=UPI0031B9DD9F
MSRAVPPGRSTGTATAGTAAPQRMAARRVAAGLLWAGAMAWIGGMLSHGMFEHWVPARTTALAVIALLALGFAWGLRRTTGLALAHGLALAWLLALAWFGDPLPLLAMLLMAGATVALGGLLLPNAPAAAQCITGLALAAGVLGWLMPLPLHARWTYLAVLAALVAWRRRELLASLQAAAGGWRRTVAADPRALALTVLVLGLASTACWPPTTQHDDVGYHLLLPWSLQLEGRLAMDPDVHAWALAPWAADVVQAIPQLLAGAEARGAVNALWLALTATALWRLAAGLGGDLRARAWTVALYASLPPTAALALGMQTELPSAAALAWAAWLGLNPPSRRALLAACALLGLLLATKLAAAGFAALLLPWLAWRHRSVLDARTALGGLALLAALGGGSYAYAWVIAGNPVLPLMNDVFGSPHFGGAFRDARWHAGFGPLLPWRMTFDTGRYLEAFPGGGGFVLVALAGAWLVALWQRRTRALAALALAMVAAPLLATQYLRYVYPALVLALPALVVAARGAAPRSAHVLLAATCIANLLFQANGHWMLRTGIVKDSVVAAGRDAATFSEYAPERMVAALVRAQHEVDDGPPGAVLALALDVPVLAEFGSAARTVSWYDPSLETEARRADADAGGATWLTLWRREGIVDLVLRADRLPPARAAALRLSGARRMGGVQDVEWWRLPPDPTGAGDAPPAEPAR